MYLITKNDRPIDIFNSQIDADFYFKTRHQKHLYKIENSIEQIPEKRYYDLLESMPPIYLDGFIFANSEPIDHLKMQGKNIALYQACFQKGGQYYQFITTLDMIKKLMPFDFQV
jgi:hypothetical protein